MTDMEWLDKIIEEQKVNTDIIDKICSPWTFHELKEMEENGGL